MMLCSHSETSCVFFSVLSWQCASRDLFLQAVNTYTHGVSQVPTSTQAEFTRGCDKI